jgi:carboxyl-terminal processing protease
MIKRRSLLAFTLILLAALRALAEPAIVGVGLALGIDESTKTVRIVKVMPNSPAASAGLSIGAIVSKIDGFTTQGKGLAECVRLIRGIEGTKVRLTLIDPAQNKATQVTLTRQNLVVMPLP